MTTRYAKLGVEQTLFWVHTGLVPTLSDLQVRIYDPDEVLIGTIQTTAAAAPLGLYYTDEVWLPPSVGIYTLRWTSALGGIDARDDLIVGVHPTGDEEVTVPRNLRFLMVTGLPTAEVTIYDEDLNVLGTHALVETAIPGSYETTDEITFSEEGYYVLYLKTAPLTPVQIIVVWVGERRGLQQVYLYVINRNHGGTPVYVPGVTVLVSLPDGTPQVQAVSNSEAGRCLFSLSEGQPYVVSLRHDDYTFSVNNFSITPVDPNSEDVPDRANKFYLLTDLFASTFDPFPGLDNSFLSLMTVEVVDLQGRPVEGLVVSISGANPPQTVLSGTTLYAISSSRVSVRTNANGHAEAYLVRGQEVLVALEGTSIQRFITVPNAATFNLMSLLTGSDDPFEIVVPDYPTAPRRSLP